MDRWMVSRQIDSKWTEGHIDQQIDEWMADHFTKHLTKIVHVPKRLEVSKKFLLSTKLVHITMQTPEYNVDLHQFCQL